MRYRVLRSKVVCWPIAGYGDAGDLVLLCSVVYATLYAAWRLRSTDRLCNRRSSTLLGFALGPVVVEECGQAAGCDLVGFVVDYDQGAVRVLVEQVDATFEERSV